MAGNYASPFPYLQVLTSLASGDYPLSALATWQNNAVADISSYVKNIQIVRGRQHVLDTFEAGRLTVTLDGRDGSFDPTNSSSAYYPNVIPNAQVQVLAWWNLLTANQGGATMASGWTPTNCTLAYPSYMAMDSTGANASMSASTTTTFPVTQNRPYSGMALFQASSTASSRGCALTLWFYNAAGGFLASSTGGTVTDASSGTTQALVNAISPFQATQGAMTATVQATVGALFSGETHQVSQVAVVNASSASSWYAGGGTPIYTGYADAWSPIYLDNVNTDVQLTATDALRLLDQAVLIDPVAAWAMNTFLNSAETNVYTLGESVGSTLFYPTPYTSSLNLTARGQGSMTCGSPGISTTTGTTSVLLGTNGSIFVPQISLLNGISSSNAQSICFNTTASSQGLFSVGPSLASSNRVYIDGSGHLVFAIGSNLTTASATTYNGGTWHQVTVQSAIVSGLQQASIYVDGFWAASSTFASSASWSPNIGYYIGTNAAVGLSTTAVYVQYSLMANVFSTGGMTASQILALNQTTTSQIPVTDSGTYTNDLLGLATWPTSLASVTTGQSQLQSPSSSLIGNTVLSELQTVATSENGAAFVNASGLYVFQNRYTILQGPNNVSLATFGDNPPGEIPFAKQPTIAQDDLDLYLQSNVTRMGGYPQLFTSTINSWWLFGSTTNINPTLVETGLLITTDNESMARAQWNCSHYQTALTRVRNLTVNVLADTVNMFPQTVFRELRDRVTVHRRPYTKAGGWPTNPQFSQDSYIEAITHNIDAEAATWTVDFALSPAETQSYWLLGDSTYGILGTSSRLAY